MQITRLTLAVQGLLLLLAATAVAQDYRVVTRVHLHETAVPESRPELIARSLTIWHAGKVYDYMDNVGELVIYDPQQQLHTIISGPHKTGCTVAFGELRQYLKVARTEAREFINELLEANRPEASRAIAKVMFQLDPHFEYRWNEKNHQLLCDSPQLSYDVQAVPAAEADVATVFRNHADMAAQLNFVLHGQSLMPDARMLVNAALAEKNWIPTRVRLSLKDQRGTVLTAEHTIQWDLGSTDRTRLLEWKNLQQEGTLKFVSFQDYQRTVLASNR